MGNNFRKKRTIVAAAIMIVFSLVSVFSGCTVTIGPDPEEYKDKSILYVSYYNRGYGKKWLEAVAAEFEEFYKDTSFEEGKKGVKIIPVPSDSGALPSVIQTSFREQVYMIDGMYDNDDYADVLLDITDAVVTPLGEPFGTDVYGNPLPGYEGETRSISDKMPLEYKNYYNRGDDENMSFYAVPLWVTFNGLLNYDVDLFDKNRLFFKSDNTLGANMADVLAGNCGTGVDNVLGTYDDGLPRNYEEFYILCQEMKSRGIVPIALCGNWNYYSNDLLNNLLTQAMGPEQMKILREGTGTLKRAIDGNINSDGTYSTKQLAVTPGNIKDFYNTEEMFSTLKVIEKIVVDRYVDYTKTFNSMYTHLTTQRAFIFNKDHGGDTKNYGILLDGSWWECEAGGAFEEMEKNSSYKKSDRRVGVMPVPFPDESYLGVQPSTVLLNYMNAAVANKNTKSEHITLAKTWIRFFNTDRSIKIWQKFVMNPSVLMVELTEEEKNEFSFYARQLFDLYSASYSQSSLSNTEFFLWASKSDWFRLNKNEFKKGSREVRTAILMINNSPMQVDDALTTFKNYPIINALDYFNGIKRYRGFS